MPSRVTAVHPHRAIEGGRITIDGSGFPLSGPRLPEVRIGDLPARVVFASPTRLSVVVPAGIPEGGPIAVRIEGVAGETPLIEIAAPFATGLHQVDNPVFDADGNLYVTYSGTRGQQVPVSIFRVRPNGTRETFASGIVNPTSLAMGPDGRLYVSSRFEGSVYRVDPDGSLETYATDLGVACGLVFGPDGSLFVGDRSGTIFRVDAAGRATPFASLPPSVAAFHLASPGDGSLFVTGPTLASYDAVYHVDAKGNVNVHHTGFGRPQGLTFDPSGTLFVVEALAGASGVWQLPADGAPVLSLSGPGLVGLAFGPDGSLVVCSNDTAYRLVNGRRR
ncbi:MAG: IPT/TIG domain-containing protein [Betaproteobacteria bacterium]